MIHHVTDIVVPMPLHAPSNHTTRPAWTTAKPTKIGVIGAGAVGLQTAVEFARRGHEVVCADIGSERGPESATLADDVRRNTRTGCLRFTSSSADAARHGGVIVMAVAPRSPDAESYDGEDHEEACLSAAAVEVARNLSGPTVIVDKTTTSEATADRIARLMARHSNHEIVVVSGSQAAREQPAIRVFLRSDQVFGS